MGERDYRVTYRSRELDEDERDGPRRIPTALDPYLYPEDRDELKRNIAMMKARNRGYEDDYRRTTVHDDDHSTTAVKYKSRPSTRTTMYDDPLSTVVRENTRENARPGTTKTTYSVTEAGLERESDRARRPVQPSRQDTVFPEESISRQSSFEESEKINVRREKSRAKTMPHESIAAATSERSRGGSRRADIADDRYYDRYDDREREYSVMDYEVERPQKKGGVYVVDIGDSRGFGGYRGDPYEDAKSGFSRGTSRPVAKEEKRSVYVERDDVKSSTFAGAPYVSGARGGSKSQTEFRGPSRATTRARDDFRETKREPTMVSAHRGGSRAATKFDEDEYPMQIDDRRLGRPPTVTEDFRDPFGPDPSLMSDRGRQRANTFEEDYVMVSPPRKSVAPTEVSRKSSGPLRSALIKDDSYSPDERRRRRRSRSIQFREAECEHHYAGDRFHQAPGAEACLAGKFLTHYDDPPRRDRGSERTDLEYDRRTSRSVGRYDRSERDSRYVKEDRYAPQQAPSRSRRRKTEEDDDESYVSRNFEKTIKTTYY